MECIQRFSKFRNIGCLLLCVPLSNCASLPADWRQDGLDVKALSLAIQCELAGGYSQIKNITALDRFAAAIDLDLKVIVVNGGGTSAALAIPVPPDKLKIGIVASYEDTSTRDAKMSFVARFDELKYKYVKDHGNGKNRELVEKCQQGWTGFPPASATLGIADWISDSVGSISESDDAAELTSGGYILNFKLVRKADGSIGLISSRVTDSKFGLNVDKTRENQINIAITAIKDYKKWQPQGSKVNEDTKKQLKFQLFKNLIDTSVSQNGTRSQNITIMAPAY